MFGQIFHESTVNWGQHAEPAATAKINTEPPHH